MYQQMLADAKTDREDRKQQIEELRAERDHYKTDRNELRERMEQMARSFMDWRIEADNDRSQMKLSIAKLGRKVEMMAPFMCGDLSCKHRQRVVISENGEIKTKRPEKPTKKQEKEPADIEPLNSEEL
jgi:chromosome segregation ATPase